MAAPKETPARIFARRLMQRVHDALKPLLTAAGVRAVEERIGRPERFFQKSRERDALRLSDYLATCAILEEAPDVLLAQALAGEVPKEIRPPRIVGAAWRRIHTEGGGLGQERLAELEASLHVDPSAARKAITAELDRASKIELPQLLGMYASALRADADLSHAHLVLREAAEMARTLGAPRVEADLLIRRAYLALEYRSPTHALRHAQEGMIEFAREEDREGEGKSFVAMGIFRYYSQEYRAAIRDLDAALKRCKDPRRIVTAHQVRALCWLELNVEDEARRAAATARRRAARCDESVLAKLAWLDARLSYGSTRIGHLKDAQAALTTTRPSDCIMVTVELIEEYLSLNQLVEAAGEVPLLCTLIERAAESRQVQRAVSRLIRHRTRLTSELVADLRRALDRARDRRLASVTDAEL